MKGHFMRAIVVLVLALTGLAVNTSAAEDPSSEPLTEPGVLLTFDDTHVGEWVAVLPLFAKYDAKATFFVTRFDQLSPEQVSGLKQIEAAGHTIGCHGLRHIKATDYTQAHGVEAYVAAEIAPALKAMRDAGFQPKSFAYPMSRNNSETDTALLEQFRHLRTGTAPKAGERYADMDVLFTPLDEVGERACLPGKGIDRIGAPGNEALLEQLVEAMERAANHAEILTLYAHGIAESGKHHHIQPDTLEKVLQTGQKLGLRFYSFDELP